MPNGKAKGSEFERTVAKMLTKWMGGTGKDVWVWRSPSSGAMINLGKKQLSGDLIALRPEAIEFFDCFSVECKCGYPDANPLMAIWNPKIDDLREFWIQCNKDAERAEKFPLLIYKKSGKSILIGFDENGLKKFNTGLEDIPFTKINYDKKYKLPYLYLMSFDTFINIVDYKSII